MANIYKLSFTGKEIDEKLTNIDIFENRIAALETGGAGGGSDNVTSTFVNVQDFGAVGDGITDDTRAIQDALDSGIGRTVYFPSGTYLLKTALFNANTFGIAHSLEVYSNQRLYFDKGAVLKRGAYEVSHILFTHNDSDATGYNGASNIEIVGATVDANCLNNSDAIFGKCTSFNLSHATNVRVIDCTFINGSGQWHSIEVNASKDVLIYGCKFLNNNNMEDIQLDHAVSSGNLGADDETATKDIAICNCIFDISNKAVAIGSHNDALHTNTKIYNNVFRGGANLTRGYINFMQSHCNIDIFNNTFCDTNVAIIHNEEAFVFPVVYNNRFDNVITPFSNGIVAYDNIINGTFYREGYSAPAVTLPSGYKQVSHLEGTGTQYIDTDYKVNQATSVNIDFFEVTDTSVRYQTYIGATSSESIADVADAFQIRQYQNSGKLDYQRGVAALFQNSFDDTSGTILVKGLSISCNNLVRQVNASTVSYDGIYPLYLFAVNAAGTAQRMSHVKLGTITIKEGANTIIHSFIPCLDNNDKPCYYDAITKETLYNAGDGEFLYGDIIAE